MTDDDKLREARPWSRRGVAAAVATSAAIPVAAFALLDKDDIQSAAGGVSIVGRGRVGEDMSSLEEGLARAVRNNVPAVLRGTFRLLGSVTVPSGAVVIGAGAVIHQEAASTVTLRTAGNSQIRLWGVRITGYGDDYVNASSVFASAGILVDSGSKDVRITDCHVVGAAGAGILIMGSDQVDIAGCTLIGAGRAKIKNSTYNYSGGIVAHSGGGTWSAENNDISGYAQGIVTDPDQVNYRIVGNRIHDIPGQHGLYLESVQRGVVQGNVVWNTGLDGLKIQVPPPPAAGAVDVIVMGNVFESVGSSGIVLTNFHSLDTARLRHVVIASNVVETAAEDGITVIGVGGVLVHDNIVSAVGRHGLSVRNCVGLEAHHNRISSSGDAGINVADSVDWTIDSNRVADPGQRASDAHGIQILGNSSDGLVCRNKVTDLRPTANPSVFVGTPDAAGAVPSIKVVAYGA